MDISDKNKSKLQENIEEILGKIGENNINEIQDRFWIKFLGKFL